SAAGVGDDYAHELGAGCGDAYDDGPPHESTAAALEAGPADSGTFPADDEGEAAYAVAHSVEGPADSGTWETEEDAPHDTAYSNAASDETGDDEYGQDEPPSDGY